VPGELTLMQQFGVARVTVRRALQELAGEGLIARERGRGTRPVIRDPFLHQARAAAAACKTTRLTGLLENLVSTSLNTTVRVLEVTSVAASAEVAQACAVTPGGGAEGGARALHPRRPAVAHHHLGARRPGLALRQARTGEEADPHAAGGIRRARRRRPPDHLGPAGRCAGRLPPRVAVGSALLAVRRLIHDEQGRPVQWLHGLYRPDRYEYQMQLSRVGDIAAKVWVSRELSAQFH
jgi:GntR family transcriptional regulator